MKWEYRRLNKPKPGLALPAVECFPAIGSAVPARCCHFPDDLVGSVGEPPGRVLSWHPSPVPVPGLPCVTPRLGSEPWQGCVAVP